MVGGEVSLAGLRDEAAAVALLVVLFSSDWRLALACLIVLPAIMLPTMRIGKRIRRTSRSTQDRQAELNQILQETLSGHMVVKAFTAEDSGRLSSIYKNLGSQLATKTRKQEASVAFAIAGLVLLLGAAATSVRFRPALP